MLDMQTVLNVAVNVKQALKEVESKEPFAKVETLLKMALAEMSALIEQERKDTRAILCIPELAVKLSQLDDTEQDPHTPLKRNSSCE